MVEITKKSLDSLELVINDLINNTAIESPKAVYGETSTWVETNNGGNFELKIIINFERFRKVIK